MSEVRRADGVGPAFAADVGVEPDGLELEPEEEGLLVVTLRLDEETYEPDVLYVGTLQITGHGEPRLEVPLRITATGPVATTDSMAGGKAPGRLQRSSRSRSSACAAGFPAPTTSTTYWGNLAEGVESITPLSREEMRAAGVPDEITQLPGYVNASPLLDDVDEFDAEFFGFSARDAALTDPQHRLFLETAWEALEDAGYDPATLPGRDRRVRRLRAQHATCTSSTRTRDALGYIDGMQLMVTNDKDHLCTQVSYRLNLRGPSVVVQTTCSTSLVAVALACESLHARPLRHGAGRRRDRAGAAARRLLLHAGSILSPDGHCRPFDAEAQGTIVGSGVGLVVLKRLERRAGGRRQRPGGDPRRRPQQRRQRQGRLHGAELRGQAAAIRAAHGRRRRLGRVDRLRRGARHRHDPRRPDRAVGADRGVPRGTRPARLLRHRLGEVELRPPVVRGRRRRD